MTDAGTSTARVAFEPIARSPMSRLHRRLGATFSRDGDWEVPATYGDVAAEGDALRNGVGICDVTARGKVDMRGAIAPLYARIARTSEGWQPGGLITLEPAPSEEHPGLIAPISDVWAVLFCPPAGVPTRLAELEPPPPEGSAMVTDASSLMAGIALSGPRTFDLLSRITGFDLGTLPPGSCAQTRLLDVSALLVHRDLERPVLEVWVSSSYGRYAWESIAATGERVNGRPVGRDALVGQGWW